MLLAEMDNLDDLHPLAYRIPSAHHLRKSGRVFYDERGTIATR